MNYKKYIKKKIFPEYKKNDNGHNIDHINKVIDKILEYNKEYKLDEKLLYIAASYHDVAHHIDKDKHEILSAEFFSKDEFMKENLTEEEFKIVFEAIEDHRSSGDKEPRSIYGKLLLSADKSMSIEDFIYRTHNYSLKHFPNYTKEEMIKRAYNHLMDKYGTNGYAKTYLENDKDLFKFKEKCKSYENDYEKFSKEYNQIIYIDRMIALKNLRLSVFFCIIAFIFFAITIYFFYIDDTRVALINNSLGLIFLTLSHIYSRNVNNKGDKK